MQYKTIYLKANEDRRIKHGHLWLYSNEIDTNKTPLKNFTSGELVQIVSATGKALGIGYINPQCLLAIRLLILNTEEVIDEAFFYEKLRQALLLRESLFNEPYYRLVFGESDFLPGLVVDRFGDYYVLQSFTSGMDNLLEYVVNALKKLLNPLGIYVKNDASVRQLEGLEDYSKIIYGEIPEEIILAESNLKFAINLSNMQKTGWFYDQRHNRQSLQSYVKNKKVLDLYSYVGSFGIYAAANGATSVTCVDSSEKAINAAQNNIKLNGFAGSSTTVNVGNTVNAIKADVFDYLESIVNSKEKFDVILLDPPAFIKKKKDIVPGSKKYQKLHELAIKCLKPTGFLVSSSCSMLLKRDMHLGVLQKASIKENVQLQILEYGGQSMDHPIHPAIPETEYLTTIFCRVLKKL